MSLEDSLSKALGLIHRLLMYSSFAQDSVRKEVLSYEMQIISMGKNTDDSLQHR